MWLKDFTRSLLLIDLIPRLSKEFGHLIHDLNPEGVWRRRETLGTGLIGFGADPLLTGDGGVWSMYGIGERVWGGPLECIFELGSAEKTLHTGYANKGV